MGAKLEAIRCTKIQHVIITCMCTVSGYANRISAQLQALTYIKNSRMKKDDTKVENELLVIILLMCVLSS